MKRNRQYYYFIANKIIDRFDLKDRVFPNQLAEMLDNWDWQYKKNDANSQDKELQKGEQNGR
jgi:hypothetical protein